MQSAPQSLNKLVSLTFDESPKVRREAAKSLGALDDPAAIFALVELSYDKDPSVKTIAQDILDQKKKSEKEVMSFAEMFSSGKKEEVCGAAQPMEIRERVLQPITMLFEKRLGKEKADRVRQKMMPAIEKIYMKTIEDRKREPTEESGRKAMQEFLTSYLEAVSDAGETASTGPDIEGNQEHGGIPDEFQVREQLADELGEVATKEKQFEMVAREIDEIEAAEEVVEKKQDITVEKLPDMVFKKAYEAMMLSDGDDGVMKHEMERAIKNAKHDVKLAYTLAKKRFKETNITHITRIKNGMRNVNTEDLVVKESESMEYDKSRKVKEIVTRMVVNDGEGNEGVVYLFDGRGTVVKPGMAIRVVRGYVKTFDFSGETALTISKKGNVYIVL